MGTTILDAGAGDHQGVVALVPVIVCPSEAVRDEGLAVLGHLPDGELWRIHYDPDPKDPEEDDWWLEAKMPSGSWKIVGCFASELLARATLDTLVRGGARERIEQLEAQVTELRGVKTAAELVLDLSSDATAMDIAEAITALYTARDDLQKRLDAISARLSQMMGSL